MANHIPVAVDETPDVGEGQVLQPLAFKELTVFGDAGKKVAPTLAGYDNAGTFVEQSKNAGAVDDGTQRITHASDDPLVSAFGAKSDAAAASDTGNFGVIAYLKRLMQKLTAQLPAALGQTTKSASLPVVLASDQDALPITDNNGSLTVDGSVSVSGLIPGTTASSLGKAEDAPAADGDTGVMALAVRKDTAATQVGSDGDYAPLLVDNNGRLYTNGSGVIQPISAASLPLPTGAAAEATLATRLSESDFDTKTGALTETAPATDTASSGVNGRLQRIAQRLSSLIGLFPTSLGQKTKANSLAVAIASDQDPLSVLLSLTGLTPFRSINVKTTVLQIKGSAGTLGTLQVSNSHATNPRYLKIFDSPAGSVVLGTTTPVFTFLVPPNYGGSFTQQLRGFAFANGISIAATTGVTDGDTAAPGDNEVICNAGYL